jgi:Uracil-DNA glycosylase (EC 3.2.2.-)
MRNDVLKTKNRQNIWKNGEKNIGKKGRKMTWTEALAEEHKKPYYKDLYNFIQQEYNTNTVYPPKDKIMTATALTPLENVKCVILGQDPYHGPNQAMGLAFSVNRGVATPPSLRNIYIELNREFGYPIPNHGDLSNWGRQGVLLLNAVLTVRAGSPTSHAGHGWETYTDKIISIVNEQDRPIVFLLWGNYAKAKKSLLNNPKHLILETTHPSPYSASSGFLGCNHFKIANEFLLKNGAKAIDWQIK